jgi:uncharacterized membrane protein YesL
MTVAGFFGLFDYTKEGPGVPKDAPPKSRFIIFFEVLARKFWNIIKVNLMYCMFNIPAFIFLLFFSMYYLQLLIPIETMENPETDLVSYLFGFAIPILLIFLCLPLIAVGPAQAGMTFILRNYSREEHAFIWSDFIEHAKKNFKQSMIVGVINALVTIVVLMDIYIYRQIQSDNLLFVAANALIIMAFIIFMMMSMYIYPMMVTFKLTIRQLYKNALLFAIMKFIPNLLILIVCFAIVIAPFYFSPVIGYLLLIFITMAFISYITNFYVYSKIDKYMIQRVENSADDEQGQDEQEQIDEHQETDQQEE